MKIEQFIEQRKKLQEEEEQITKQYHQVTSCYEECMELYDRQNEGLRKVVNAWQASDVQGQLELMAQEIVYLQHNSMAVMEEQMETLKKAKANNTEAEARIHQEMKRHMEEEQKDGD